jgi:outer membrane protein assembly factor BamB
MTYRRFVVCAVGCGTGIALLSLLLAANWPQWRGPGRDGLSAEIGLLQEWPAEGPPLLWQQSGLGDGYSTPAVVGDRIYLVSSEGLDNEFVQALAVEGGRRVWSTRIGKVGEPDQQPNYPGARSTPTIDGDRVYALGSDGDLACLDRATGQVRWQKNVRSEFGGKPGEWAFSESPLVDGETVVVTPGGEEATLVALDKNSGDVIWKSQVPGGDAAGYASVIIVNAAGVKQYVQFLAKGLVGVNANTGEFLWRYERPAQSSPANIGTPVAQDEYVYSGSHYAGGGLVRLVARNGGVDAEEVYFDRKYPTAIGGAVLVGDYLYGTTRATMVCAHFKTGEVKWTQERGVAPASLCYADGRLYLHGETDGQLALVEATPEAYRERGRFTPPNIPDRGNGKAWAYPVVADGRLYVHDWGTLWCYNLKPAASGG